MSQYQPEEKTGGEVRGFRPAIIVFGGMLGVLALLIFLLLAFPAAPAPSVEIAMIDGIEKQLLQEGFKLEEHTMAVDEISLGPANFLKRTPLTRLYPGYQTRFANRRYSRDGAQLGIHYGIVNNRAVNISLPADPLAAPRANLIFREIVSANPYVSISLWTNSTVVERSLNVVR